MNQLKVILVGVDFSDNSKSALAQAARLSQWNQARLHVAHVIESDVLQEIADTMNMSLISLQETTVVRAQEKVRAWVHELHPDCHPEVEIRVGNPLDSLLTIAQSIAADLLVLGEEGATGSGQGAGMLATKCLRKAACKVLLVNESHTSAFRTVLACVDFSATARQVVSQAMHVAALDGGQVHFLHLFESPWRRLAHLRPIPEIFSTDQGPYQAALQARLHDFVSVDPSHQMSYHLQEASSIGHGISNSARTIGADLIILGTRGHSSLKHVLLGSTAERVLRDVPCSILSIRTPDNSFAPLH